MLCSLSHGNGLHATEYLNISSVILRETYNSVLFEILLSHLTELASF